MNMPKLRFKGFEDTWEQKKVNSFLERIIKPVNVIENQSYIQIGIRSHGKGIFHKEPINGKDLGNKKVFWVEPKSFIVNIVFAWEQAIAVTSDIERGMIASHRFPMYLPKQMQSDINFIKYLFLTKKGKNYLELASPGGAGRNKTLGQNNFLELEVNLPSKQEQTKIASFLSAVDDKIAALRQEHDLWQQYKQGMMQQLFSQTLRFQDDNGQDFPDWEERTLGELSIRSYQGINTVVDKIEYQSEGYPILQAKHITNEYLDFTDIRYISDLDFEKYKEKYLPRYNDILFSNIGTIGKVVLVGETNPFFIAWNIFLISVNSKDVYPSYLAQYLRWLSSLKYFDNLSTGNATKFINKTDLLNIKIGIACLEEQTKIAACLTSIDAKIAALAQQLEQARVWKQGLLQQMFV